MAFRPAYAKYSEAHGRTFAFLPVNEMNSSHAPCPQLIIVLGDQLSIDISSLQSGDPERDTVLIAEVSEEASYVPHHKKKIAFLFSAMRHFALELKRAGWTVRYVKLDDPENTGSITGEIERALTEHALTRAILTEPGEYRLKTALSAWDGPAPLIFFEDKRFVSSHAEFRAWASGRKKLRMECFYREMRRKTGLLMDDGAPEGGKWNYTNATKLSPIGSALAFLLWPNLFA